MKKTIVICDDDKIILEVIQIILGDDYNIITFNNEKDLFKSIDKISPSLIFLDVWIGESDGRKVIKTLKAKNNLNNVPVVLISALHDLEKISEESEANGYLKKPFIMEELTNLVNQMVD